MNDSLSAKPFANDLLIFVQIVRERHITDEFVNW